MLLFINNQSCSILRKQQIGIYFEQLKFQDSTSHIYVDLVDLIPKSSKHFNLSSLLIHLVFLVN